MAGTPPGCPPFQRGRSSRAGGDGNGGGRRGARIVATRPAGGYDAGPRPIPAGGPMSPTRRQVLTGLGAVAAGQLVLADAVGQDRNPAANVADRSSTIKITRTRATWVGPAV